MLGTLRLLLALAVAASHTNLRMFGLNPGVMAVVGFYLISGYVMAGLIRRHYSQGAQAPAFYLDRAIRLLPQYLFYAGLTLAWYGFTQANTQFLSHAPSAGDLVNNLLIIPLNYYMYNGSDGYTLIPPAWSLGAEVQFYLLAPWLLVWPKRLLAFGLLSLSVYLAALAGIINSDWFGYRLLPGVLLFFLLGAWLQGLHQQGQQRQAQAMTLGVAALATLAIGLLFINGNLRQPYNFETLLGLIFGLLLLQALATRPRTRWDGLAGDISYGVFLNHFLIIWTFYPQGVSSSQLPGFLALSMALSCLSQRLVEQSLLKLRHRFRKTH
ncbi:O-acetyltransferase OatA [Polaromonas vacuolata]|uniref:O-acetyltransferase OatA n=1 Tax=Polaromonas vacuolata TaxID=37448 RepID=A0A6H2H5Q6_9BURK|nr:acyltransferase [Polaromonas vacuolata]QJC55212.1 O-acetyltransferase OatA [Polaromonas vacuolata]